MSPTDHEEDDLRRLADLYRANPPRCPSEAAWSAVFEGIARALPDRPSSRGAGWWGPLAGAALAAACLGVAVFFQPPPGPGEPGPAVASRPGPAPGAGGADDEDVEPLEVAAAAEIFILKADLADADRIALGQPLMGAFEVTAPGDAVEIKAAHPNPDGLTSPRLRHSGQLTMIINASDDEDEPE